MIRNSIQFNKFGDLICFRKTCVSNAGPANHRRLTVGLRVGYTIVWSGKVMSTYHDRLWYNVLIPWPSCYGQHGPMFNAI